MDSAAVVSRGDAPEVLKLVEEALDAIAHLVCARIVGNGPLSCGDRRDHGFCAGFVDDRPDEVAVEGAIGNHTFGRSALKQLGCCDVIGRLSAGDDEV